MRECNRNDWPPTPGSILLISYETDTEYIALLDELESLGYHRVSFNMTYSGRDSPCIELRIEDNIPVITTVSRHKRYRSIPLASLLPFFTSLAPDGFDPATDEELYSMLGLDRAGAGVNYNAKETSYEKSRGK